MSGDEREAWWNDLVNSSTLGERAAFAEALLDRVDQLERELAAAREAYDSLSETDTKLIGQLRDELAAVRMQRTIDRQRIEMDDLELDRLRRELAAARAAMRQAYNELAAMQSPAG